MPTEENPTGLPYLKTFQALFQIIELLLLLVTWALISSQTFFLYPSLNFALAVFVATWVITLIFFILYITGLHVRINDCCARIGGSSQPSAGTTGSLQPTPEARRFISAGVAWFVVEYVIYLVIDVFLFVSVIIVSAKAFNSHYIAAAVFGWVAFIVYDIHFFLLVRNTEGVWPHTLVIDRCKRKSAPKSESESLLSDPPPSEP